MDPDYVIKCVGGRIYVCRIVRSNSPSIIEEEQKPIVSWSRTVKNYERILTLNYDGK